MSYGMSMNGLEHIGVVLSNLYFFFDGAISRERPFGQKSHFLKFLFILQCSFFSTHFAAFFCTGSQHMTTHRSIDTNDLITASG